MKLIFSLAAWLVLVAYLQSAWGQNLQVQQQGGIFTGFKAVSPDDRYAISNEGLVLDIKKGIVLHRMGELGAITLWDDSRHLVSLTTGYVRVIDYTTNTVVQVFKSDNFSPLFPSNPISTDGKWLLYWSIGDIKKPLENVLNAPKNEILKKQTMIQEAIHIIRLDRGDYHRSIAIESVNNCVAGEKLLAVTRLAGSKETPGTRLELYELETGTRTMRQQLGTQSDTYPKMFISPGDHYLLGTGVQKQHFALEIKTEKRLKSLGTEELDLLFSVNYLRPDLLRFSKDGKKLALISTVATPASVSITVADMERDTIIFRKKTGIYPITQRVSSDLQFFAFFAFNPAEAPGKQHGTLLMDQKGKESIIPSAIGTQASMGNFIFTNQTQYLLQQTTDYGKHQSFLNYIHLGTRRSEYVIPLLSQNTVALVSYLASTGDLYFLNSSNSHLFELNLWGKHPGPSPVPFEKTVYKVAYHEQTRRICQIISVTSVDLKGKKQATRDDSLNAYSTRCALMIGPMDGSEPLQQIMAPTSYFIEQARFNPSGDFIYFWALSVPKPFYKNGIPTYNYDTVTPQRVLYLADIKTKQLKQLATLDYTSADLVLANDMKSAYTMVPTADVDCSARKLLPQKSAPSNTYAVNIVKLNLSDKRVSACYEGPQPEGRFEFLAQADHRLVVGFQRMFEKWAIILDPDLVPLKLIPVANASTLYAGFNEKQNQMLLRVQPHHDRFDVPDRCYLYNTENWTCLDSFPTPDFFDKDLIFYEDYLIFPGGMYDLKLKKTKLTWVFYNEMDFLIKTPDNYYMASKNVAEALRFTRKDQSMPFRQYDLLYNRPDKVLAALSKSDPVVVQACYKAYLKRLQKSGFSEDKLSADTDLPVVRILNKNSPFEKTQTSLRVEIEASDPKLNLDRILVWVNDVPVPGRNGLSLRSKALQAWKQTLTIPLSAGRNQIQVSCLNEKGVESLLDELIVHHLPVAAQKPNLYVLSCGVSAYRDSAMNLRYAAKDASDIAAFFADRKDQYGKVFTKTLLNRDVTSANLRAAKAWLQQSQTDDRVVVFVSGHGLLDKNLDYYLATYDVDFSKPDTKGLPFDALEALLDSIPPRYRLILMDACHSGELDKENTTVSETQVKTDGHVRFRSFSTKVQTKQIGLQNSFELMKEMFVDLRRSSGATVISSAGGAEYALEGDAWKNGVFTYSLLDGLRNKDADANKDGSVMISELQNYLNNKVSELTKGRQKPTFRAENVANDWRIW